MRKLRKKYKRPLVLWDKERIDRERAVMKTFGLRKKHEIWVAETLLRNFRRGARILAAKKDKAEEKLLIQKLVGLGLVEASAGLDDALGLTLGAMLERRLQTIVFRKGLANTPNQARQFIVHGHITIDGRKIVYPSYIVPKSEESKIQVEVKTPSSKSPKKEEVITNEG
jgi:small subunit ribosomal protein S4